VSIATRGRSPAKNIFLAPCSDLERGEKLSLEITALINCCIQYFFDILGILLGICLKEFNEQAAFGSTPKFDLSCKSSRRSTEKLYSQELSASRQGIVTFFQA
jgi:hypothetical protein